MTNGRGMVVAHRAATVTLSERGSRFARVRDVDALAHRGDRAALAALRRRTMAILATCSNASDVAEGCRLVAALDDALHRLSGPAVLTFSRPRDTRPVRHRARDVAQGMYGRKGAAQRGWA